MEPIFDNELSALIAAYGGVREARPSPRRCRRIAKLVADLLALSGLESIPRSADVPVLALRHDGATVLIVTVWTGQAMTHDELNTVVATLRDPFGPDTVIVLSMSGFSGGHSAAAARIPARLVLWDRTHLEAALCGLVTMHNLLELTLRSALLQGVARPTLAALLTLPDRGGLARMRTPDLAPPLWPLFQEPYTGVPAELVLVGEDGWEPSTGIAALDEHRLLVTTVAGVVELNAARGTTSWLTRLPGCVNDTVAQSDGSVLVVCHQAVVRVTDGSLIAVAGGFTGDVHLIAGPDGDTWVLSGIAHTYGSPGSLALTRIGDHVGQQQRYDIHFPANVHTAGWLADRRFFLAAAGHCAVIDLDRRARVTQEDWIDSPHAYRAHLVVAGPHRAVTASGSPTGVGVALTNTDLTTRENQHLADVTVNAVRGLCATPAGTGYLWGDVYAGRHGSHDPWPVLVRLPNLFRSGTIPANAATGKSSASMDKEPDMSSDPYDAVRRAARGDRKAYALDPKPIDDGGQAVVFGARHKATGVRVAFKRRSSDAEDAVARMKREVDIAHALGDKPHVMPVLDHGPGYEWFVMPLADTSAADCRQALSTAEALRELVTAICEGLRPAHQLGWIHRDLKPANLLRWDGVWAVADWGLGRRPRGQTTNPHRTRVGMLLGTEGFAAPELATDAHQAGPAADIYSIGQIIGWAMCGTWPQANIALLPASGPWRHIAKQATQHDPSRRPATVDAFLDLIRMELDHDHPDGSDPAQHLLVAAGQGDDNAASELFSLAVRQDHDLAFYSDVMARLSVHAIRRGAASDPARTTEIVRALHQHLNESSQLNYADAARIITFLHHIQVWAAGSRQLDLLQDTAETLLAWDERWNQWTPQKQIRTWMATLTGEAAGVIAGALRREPGAARHFEEILEHRGVDERIRRAVRP